jgi:hypothetical protein
VKNIRSLSAITLALAVVIGTSGCFKYMIKTGDGGDTRGQPTASVWQHHLIDGMIGEGIVDVEKVCGGSPNATISIERNMVDAILGNLTGNLLWNPSTINVYCGDKVAEVELDAEQTERVASTPAFREAVEETAPERLSELDERLAQPTKAKSKASKSSKSGRGQ